MEDRILGFRPAHNQVTTRALRCYFCHAFIHARIVPGGKCPNVHFIDHKIGSVDGRPIRCSGHPSLMKENTQRSPARIASRHPRNFAAELAGEIY